MHEFKVSFRNLPIPLNDNEGDEEMNILPDTFEGLVLLVAIIASLLTLFCCFKEPVGLRWISALLVPFIIAYPIYWMPEWLRGGNFLAYDSWELLGVGVPYLAGLICSLLVILTVHLVRKKRSVASTQST